MAQQGCITRAVAILLILIIVCSITGAVKIQTERQYPDNAAYPNSSPVMVGTAVFTNSTTTALSVPYKTNSWLSPILWADSTTLYYPGDYFINQGERHPLYQLPVYPLPWSLYYCKTTADESKRFDMLNSVDPTDTSNLVVPNGLFIRPMPIFSLYDTQLQKPDGSYDPDTSLYNMYALAGEYSAPSVRIEPGFNASHIRINRMGDYDAGLLLLAQDDPNPPAGVHPEATLAIDIVRGSPFVYLTTNKIPAINLSIWHGQTLTHTTRTVPAGGKNIVCEIITTPLKSYGVAGTKTSWDQNTYWENQTIIYLYPEGSAQFSEVSRDPIYRTFGDKAWLYNRTDASFTFTSQQGPGYLVMATVPSPDFCDTTTLEALAAAAFMYPAGSSVTYQYSHETGEVTATYSLETQDPLRIGGEPVQGLLPLHYGEFFNKPSVLQNQADWLVNGTGAVMVTNSILGDIRYLKGASFTCSYQYPGILPYIPSLPKGDTQGISNLTKWLKNVENQFGKVAGSNYQYTLLDTALGKTSYDAGKLIWSTTNLYRTAQGLDPKISSDAADSAARSISLIFADNPRVITVDKKGQAPYYAYYDPTAATIIVYPAGVNPDWPPNDQPYLQWDGFGTATVLNDHHYTWGYFINAAAEIGLDNATWMQEHKDIINQLVYDVAYSGAGSTGANNFKYPKMRLWDPYTGHSEAVGMTGTYYAGNNDESISEELHFWAGVIRWGSASGQEGLVTLGIEHYTHAVYAYYTFWRDYFHNYPKLWSTIKGSDFDPLWVSENYAPQIWDGKIKATTFFGTHPAATGAITVLPMTGASFYHAIDTAWISSFISSYKAFVTTWNNDPMKPQGTSWQDPDSPWAGVLAYYAVLGCWNALADPAQALSEFFFIDPDTAKIPNPAFKNSTPQNLIAGPSGGMTTAEAYHFIRFIQDYGTPDPLYAHAINTPYYMSFVKNGIRTYVVYNPTDQPVNITFSDNTVIKYVQPHQFGFYPYGYPGDLKASFTASPLAGSPPLEVICTDNSTGQITGWSWTFGDGTSSDQQNPVHTYTEYGTYQITLTVTDITSKTNTTSKSVIVRHPGELPGNFSISTLHTGDKTSGLYPSLRITSSGTSHISFFNADSTMPWIEGGTGRIGYEKLDMNQDTPVILKQENAVSLVYHAYTGQGVPDWGRSSLTTDQNGAPIIAYIDQTQALPQKLGIAWTDSGGNWNYKNDQDVGFGWTPSVTMMNDGNPGFAFASASVNAPRFGFVPPGASYQTSFLGIANIEQGGAAKPAPDTQNITLIYTISNQNTNALYYNSAAQEIRHAWSPTPDQGNTWTITVVQAGVNAGSMSAGYDVENNKIGIAWYDATEKKLNFIEKTLTDSSWGPPQTVDTPSDATCSFAYGPSSGVLPGPGISYYDATKGELKFAWREGNSWYTVSIDSGGAGSSSSLAYGKDGYPHIAYRHDNKNALMYAYLHPGTGVSASFTSDVRSGQVPLTVRYFDTTFNDSSIQIAGDDDPLIDVHYWWDFTGDGEWEEKDNPNPVYTYTVPDTYDVRMLLHIVIQFFGIEPVDIWAIADMSDYIQAMGVPSDNFTGTPKSGTPPLKVSFIDSSQGNFSTWNWTFGDGTTSHEQNPVHVYSGIGRYSVTLEATGPSGSMIERKPAYIDVHAGRTVGPTGILKISSVPDGAAIILDGEFLGQTPADSLIAPSGNHILTLQKEGYQDWSLNVQVPIGTLKLIPRVQLKRV